LKIKEGKQLITSWTASILNSIIAKTYKKAQISTILNFISNLNNRKIMFGVKKRFLNHFLNQIIIFKLVNVVRGTTSETLTVSIIR
jgi:hypothetical protein